MSPLNRHGTRRPIGMSKREVIEYYALVDEVTGCWEWQAFKLKGYGKIGFDGRTRRAHCLAYEAFIGLIPDGEDGKPLPLDHFKCNNPGCCNPEHVRPVSHRENVLRSDTSVSALAAAKTHCPRGHPYSGDNLVSNGLVRGCRTCRRRVSTLRNRRNGMKPRVLVTHCKRGHPYSGDNLYVHKGDRYCKQCKREAGRRYRAAHIAAGGK